LASFLVFGFYLVTLDTFLSNLTEFDLKFLSLLREVYCDVSLEILLVIVWLNILLFTSFSFSLSILLLGIWVIKLRSLLLIVLLNSASSIIFKFIASLDLNSLGSSF